MCSQSVSSMRSAVLRFPHCEIQRSFEELREIQKIRSKAKMERKIEIGHGTAKFVDSNDVVMQQYKGNIDIKTIEGSLYLFMNDSYGVSAFVLPCHKISYYSCQSTTITFYLEDYLTKTCIFELGTIEQVEIIIAKVKPSEKPRPNTYENDGNVTSSDTDSNDSRRGKTTGVDNSFESDNASDLSNHE